MRQTGAAHTAAVNSKALTEQGWKLRSESLLLQFSQLSSKFEAAQS
jgi:hypothetical protein